MEEIIKYLNQILKGFSYVIIGGIPVAVWGKPRTTTDVDVVARIPTPKIKVVLDRLSELGFYVPANALNRLEGLAPVKMTYGKRLSLDLRISSYSIDKHALGRAKSVILFGSRIRIASPEDLIVYKLARFDDFDKADIGSVIDNTKIDVNYLVKTTKELAEELNRPDILRNLEWVLARRRI